MSGRDTDRLMTTKNQSESGYQSIDRSTPQHFGDRNITKTKQRSCLGCAIVTFTIVQSILLLAAPIWATVYYHYHDATCNSAIPGAYTRSDSYSLLDSSFTLACIKPSNITISLQNEAASLEIYEVPCMSIEKRYFKESYSNAVNMSVNQPAPLFSEDFSPQNYFLNGIIRVDIVRIITTITSVGVELIIICLFINNDDFEDFLVAGANWKNFISNAECHLVQVETGDSNSTIFHISELTFAFVATGNVSIGNLTVTTNGVEVTGTGENATKILCQLNGKHPMCSFRVINDEREEFCLVAHEEERSDGSYDYLNLKIKLTTKTNNVQFWVCLSLSILIAHIALIGLAPFCILIRRCYKKCQSIMIETSNGSSLSSVGISEQNIQTSGQQNQLPDRESDSEAPPDEEPRSPITETPANY